MKYVFGIFLILIGLVEFILRFSLILVFVATIVGIFFIGDLLAEDILTPYLWKMAKEL